MGHRLDIQIETTDRRLDFAMFEANEIAPGTQVSLSDGSTVTWSSAPLATHAGEPDVFNLVVDVD